MKYIALIEIFCLALLLAACSSTPVETGASAPDVLTTTTILADIARNVAGDRLTVQSLLPAGADPHSYQPTPQDAASIANARTLIVNGAGYESFLQSLLDAAGGEKTLIEASAGLDPITSAQEGGGMDPHLWLDPVDVTIYAENIRDGLVAFDPDGASIYHANASAYIQQLEELDDWIAEQVEQIPAERRVLVTNHEALGHFAERYGFTIAGTILQNVSSSAAPSAQQMAELVAQIRQSQAPAIFLSQSDNPVLAQQIAAETGVRVVTDLHIESLTQGAPAGTYIDLMKHNVTRIVEALR